MRYEIIWQDGSVTQCDSVDRFFDADECFLLMEYFTYLAGNPEEPGAFWLGHALNGQSCTVIDREIA